jgi:hypothetical protein
MSKKSEFLSFVRALTILDSPWTIDRAAVFFSDAWEIDEFFIPDNVAKAAYEFLLYWRHLTSKPEWLIEADDVRETCPGQG